MAHLNYISYEGFGDRTVREAGLSQAVRVGDIIEISGQGGWDRLTEAFPRSLSTEITQAFDNADFTIRAAGGAGFTDVYKLRVYLVSGKGNDGEADDLKTMFGHVCREVKKLCCAAEAGGKGHTPILTGVEVKGLYNDMRIEVEAWAHVPGK